VTRTLNYSGRNLSSQFLKTVQGSRASFGHFSPLHNEVLAKEVVMDFTFVELLGCEHGREHRNFGAELYLHERIDDGMCHELVPVNAAIDDQPCSDYRAISASFGQQLRMQRNFEGARHLEYIYVCYVSRLALLQESDSSYVNDFPMPTRLNEGHSLRLGEVRMSIRGNAPILQDGAWNFPVFGSGREFGVLYHLIHGRLHLGARIRAYGR
jgi:hypothetical protein